MTILVPIFPSTSKWFHSLSSAHISSGGGKRRNAEHPLCTHTIFALRVVLVVPKPRSHISRSTQLYSNFNLFFGFVSNVCVRSWGYVLGAAIPFTGVEADRTPLPRTGKGTGRKRAATLATVAEKSRKNRRI